MADTNNAAAKWTCCGVARAPVLWRRLQHTVGRWWLHWGIAGVKQPSVKWMRELQRGVPDTGAGSSHLARRRRELVATNTGRFVFDRRQTFDRQSNKLRLHSIANPQLHSPRCPRETRRRPSRSPCEPRPGRAVCRFLSVIPGWNSRPAYTSQRASVSQHCPLSAYGALHIE